MASVYWVIAAVVYPSVAVQVQAPLQWAVQQEISSASQHPVTLAVDGSALLQLSHTRGSTGHKLSPQGLFRSISAEVASIFQPTTSNFARETCDAMKGREFEFHDNVCGTEKYTVPDMLTAFHTEQAYWARQGNENPWWAVDTQFPKGTEYPVERQQAFYKKGVEGAKGMLPNLHALGIMNQDWISRATALDFGCGLGRMSNGLASVGFKEVKCVDQAQSFLDAGRKALTQLAGQGAVVPDVADRVQFVQSAPDLLCAQPPASIDFVHSLITLQHMKPMLQVAYIEQFCDVLRSGGAGYFQIPTLIHTTNTYTMNKDRHCDLLHEEVDMMMHFTPQDEVEKHLVNRGCRVLSVTHANMIGDLGTDMLFIFQKL